MIDLHVMSRKCTELNESIYTYRISHASFCSIIFLLLVRCIKVIINLRGDKAVFLLSFVLCVYDIVYQIFNTMLICFLTVVKV